MTFLVFMGFEIIFLGYLLGRIRIKGVGLGTAGVFVVAILFGVLYSTEIGQAITQTVAGEKVDISMNALKVIDTTGLVLFLVGAGVAGGMKFAQYFKWAYFFYGIFITVVPMLAGYLFSKHVLKLNLLNNLGSIAGGMTSTPALGSLIAVAGTDDVASAYAATYPIALISLVISSQFFALLLSPL